MGVLATRHGTVAWTVCLLVWYCNWVDIRRSDDVCSPMYLPRLRCFIKSVLVGCWRAVGYSNLMRFIALVSVQYYIYIAVYAIQSLLGVLRACHSVIYIAHPQYAAAGSQPQRACRNIAEAVAGTAAETEAPHASCKHLLNNPSPTEPVIGARR